MVVLRRETGSGGRADAAAPTAHSTHLASRLRRIGRRRGNSTQKGWADRRGGREWLATATRLCRTTKTAGAAVARLCVRAAGVWQPRSPAVAVRAPMCTAAPRRRHTARGAPHGTRHVAAPAAPQLRRISPPRGRAGNPPHTHGSSCGAARSAAQSHHRGAGPAAVRRREAALQADGPSDTPHMPHTAALPPPHAAEGWVQQPPSVHVCPQTAAGGQAAPGGAAAPKRASRQLSSRPADAPAPAQAPAHIPHSARAAAVTRLVQTGKVPSRQGLPGRERSRSQLRLVRLELQCKVLLLPPSPPPPSLSFLSVASRSPTAPSGHQ